MSEHVTRMTDRGVRWLAALEGGPKLEAYKDSGGVWTIGVGMIRWPSGRRVVEGDTIDAVESADELFQWTLKHYERDVDAATRDDLEPNEFDALVSLAYNIGVQAFRTSTVLKRINAKLGAHDVAEAWRRWRYDEGREVPGLLKRRDCEVQVFYGGEYADQGGGLIA